MDSFTDFRIPISVLKDGYNLFEYKLSKSFFEAYDFDEIKTCNISVKLELNKTSTLLDLQYYIEGTYLSSCDRCLSDLELFITNQFRQVVKFVEKVEPPENEDVIYLSFNEYELNIASYVFEYCLLSFPVKKIHDKGKCDKKGIEILNTYLLKEININKAEFDPRWEKLKKLKQKNKN